MAALSKFFLAHKCNKVSPFESQVFISQPFEINKLGNDSLSSKSSEKIIYILKMN